MFGGGIFRETQFSSTVDAYSAALVHSTPTDLSHSRAGLAATSVGDYSLFGGGAEFGQIYSNVDAYTVDGGGSQPSKPEPPGPGTTDPDPDGPEDLRPKPKPGGHVPDKVSGED